MVHYPLATLMLAGLREVLVITNPDDKSSFERTLGDGSSLGMNIHYATQSSPRGIADAFGIASSFLAGDCVCLILGDNIFYGPGLGRQLRSCTHPDGALVFAYEVSDPSAYGVVQLDVQGQVMSIEEKPNEPKSQYAIPGLYFYSADVTEVAKSIKPSSRGELEITTVNQVYLSEGRLQASVLPRGTAWLDTGTFRTLQDAGEFVRVIQERQGTKVSCLEEIAWRSGWISDDQLQELAQPLLKSGYGEYLLKLINRQKGE
jgi:glucose-1-phosphate thymidylyltransferase